MTEKEINTMINKIVSSLTLEEKASLTSGSSWWDTQSYPEKGVPSVYVCDGPHGLRKEDDTDDSLAMKKSFPATCFPTASCSCSSWNYYLLMQMGQAMANEAKSIGSNVILGPGVNMKRSPLGGRNFEYFSEDPYLAGLMGSAFIAGAEKEGVGTSLKHYAVNSQEYCRMSISEVLDQKAFREIYLPAFEECIKRAKPATVMCSYNRINGTFSADNKNLLTDILRDEWGFDGIVVSDWGATNDRVQGILAGLDLEMPYSGGITNKQVVKAVEEGRLKEADLDKVIARLVRFALTYSKDFKDVPKYDFDISHQLARKIANESVVLLKNDENLLPLLINEKITVIGEFARTPRYQGSGSSRINPMHLTNFLEELDKNGASYQFAAGYTLKDEGFDDKLMAEAVELAKNGDKVVLFIGLTDTYESEGFDRKDLKIPASHVELVNKIHAVNKNLIVALVGGSPVEMPWLDKAKSVINMYLVGESVGEVYYDVLFGVVNPSGKLAETFPLSIEDNLADKYFRMGPKTVEHRESIFIGYRYYDTAKKEVLFPFGYGLSYTTFDISDVKLNMDAHIIGKEEIEVSFTVKNTGVKAGAEVVQVYVKDLVSTDFVADKQLAGFAKVFLKPNESKQITVTISDRAFMYYSIENKAWLVENGEFEIQVGNSSRNIIHKERVHVEDPASTAKHYSHRESSPCYYNLAEADSIPDSEWQAILGFDIPDNSPIKVGEFDRTCTINDIKDTKIGKLFAKYGTKIVLSQVGDVDQTTLICMQSGFLETPIRAFTGFTKGIVGKKMIDGILTMANGKNFKGFMMILGGIPNALITMSREKKKAKKAQKEKDKAKRIN